MGGLAIMYSVQVNKGGDWVVKGWYETAVEAVKARDWWLNQGCRPENVRVVCDR